MKCPKCGVEMDEFPAGFASESNPFPVAKSYWKCEACHIATYDGEAWYYRSMKARFTLEELLKEINSYEQSDCNFSQNKSAECGWAFCPFADGVADYRALIQKGCDYRKAKEVKKNE